MAAVKWAPDLNQLWAPVRVRLFPGESVIAFYENTKDSWRGGLAVTERGIYYDAGTQWEFVEYADMVSVEPPSVGDARDAAELIIGLRNGTIVRLQVGAASYPYSDTWGFLRFVRRVLEDRRVE